MDKILDITESFKSYKFYQGIVDLAIKRGSDFGNIETNNLNSQENYMSFEDSNQLRMQCYELIFKALISIDELPTTTANTRARISKEDASRIKVSVLSRALDTDDKLFHYSLYAWYINQNWIEQLMEIQSPYLEEYLLAGKNDIKYAEYLARFYTRKNRFFDAAQLLCEVAHYPGLSLDERLSYLTGALTNARSSSGSNSQEILSQITDELDV
jgi:nuclear pore complex protein Nup155